MRQKLIAGNWKMNGLKADSQELVAGILSGLRATPVSADILICPPFTLTASVAAAVQGSPICVGVQDVSDAPKSSGAYTDMRLSAIRNGVPCMVKAIPLCGQKPKMC